MASFKTFNPATGAFIDEHPYAQATDISRSIEQLHNGFLRWSKFSFNDRQKILRPAIGLFRQGREELAKSITNEMGKPYSATLAEIDKSIQAMEYMCTQSFQELAPTPIKTITDHQNISHHIYHKPKGVILGVMPWNFPFWQAVRMIWPALLTGNTVLLKHSEITPSTGNFIKKILSQVEVKNIFDHLIFEHSLTESVIADSRVHGVSLTGSVKAGYTLSEFAGKYMKRGVFELGGSDAHLVLDEANLVKTASVIARSRLQNTGQSCIAAKRVIVPKGKVNELLVQLVAQFNKSVFGDPLDRQTTVGPLAHYRFKNEDESRFQMAKQFSEVVFEKKPDELFIQSIVKESLQQAFVPLRILHVKKPTADFLKYVKVTEFFSPTLLVFEYNTTDEALALVNNTQFGLGGSVYSENLAKAHDIALQFDSGMVAINEAVASNVALPFGGTKASGLGRELGLQGFFEFTDTQVITTNKFE